jgi:hypothetical protein
METRLFRDVLRMSKTSTKDLSIAMETDSVYQICEPRET